MPRNRRDESDTPVKPQDLEEDYLDVDKPLSGQNYYCISFVSPEKVLEQKDKFLFYHFERSVNKKLTTLLDDALTKMIDGSKDGNIDVADIISLKKQMSTSCAEYDVSFDKFKDLFEDFKFQNEEKIGEDFDKANNFKTSVRGVKVRGVFDTKREADVRAAVLQRQDSLFDVFVGQVGYWCPWDPNPQKIEDIEYMNNDLNKLVKEYKANEVKKDMFYQEQKSQRQKESISAEERLKHQEGITKMNEYRDMLKQIKDDSTQKADSGATLNSILDITDDTSNDSSKPQAITQSLELGGETAKEVSIEDETTQLMADDPWMQRKLAEKQE
jgi:hypothetical protein